MLYFIHGGDNQKAKSKQREVVAQLREKRPSSNFVVLDGENFSEGKLDELVSGGGLFDEKHIVALNFLLGEKTRAAAIGERVEKMANSASAFVWAEEKADAKLLKAIEQYAYKTIFFEGSGGKEAKKEKDKANAILVFGIADAVGERNGSKAWLLFQKAVRKGISAEEIHGAIFWQIKNIALAKAAKTAEEAGMKPYPYDKAKRLAKNFSDSEVRDTAHTLVSLVHDSRTEDAERLETLLEKFLISLEKK